MIGGNARSFIEKAYYEDHYVIFDGEKYFVNGCQTFLDSEGHDKKVRLEVYNLSRNIMVFSSTCNSSTECIQAFEEAAIWNGRRFWEAESNMEWVDE